MFTEKTIKQTLELSEVRLKHSTIGKDYRKLTEEIEEFRKELNKPVTESDSMGEFVDLVVSALGCLMQNLKPKTEEELNCINQYLSEQFEFKSLRTKERLESGFYK